MQGVLGSTTTRQRFNTGAWLSAGLLFLVMLLASNGAQAQDWRLSMGYSLNKVGLDYAENANYNESLQPTTKGMIEVELERYLLYRFYIAGQAEYLFHNQETFMMGGPIDYNQLNLGATMGLQWAKFGFYGGVKGGRIWDVAFKGINQSEETTFISPAESSQRWTYGFTGGVKYYLLSFLRLEAELTKSFNVEDALTPEASSNVTPALNSVALNPFSFRLGASISIPWHSRSNIKRYNNRSNLPKVRNVGNLKFRSPLDRTTIVTSPYGKRWRDFHEGTDVDADRGDNIVAVEDGVVVKAGTGNGYGRMVKIQHGNGYTSLYAHMSRLKVKTGERVKKGEVIGKAGNTGTSTGIHLHFELLKNGQPVDPQKYIRF
jgi:murein DD-endopeptidase MepM/ murein hydrolase activator NlpD